VGKRDALGLLWGWEGRTSPGAERGSCTYDFTIGMTCCPLKDSNEARSIFCFRTGLLLSGTQALCGASQADENTETQLSGLLVCLGLKLGPDSDPHSPATFACQLPVGTVLFRCILAPPDVQDYAKLLAELADSDDMFKGALWAFSNLKVSGSGAGVHASWRIMCAKMARKVDIREPTEP